MNSNVFKKVVAVAVFSSVSMMAMAGDNSRADRMGERPIEEFSLGSALVVGEASESHPSTLAASPTSGTLDNLADLKVQSSIENYSLRIQVNPDFDTLAAPAAGSETSGGQLASAEVIELPYETVDYGHWTASEKRQRFFGQDD